MKTVVLFLLNIYQRILSPLLHQLLGQRNMCRYEISCSEFAKRAVIKEGVLKGGMIAIKRFLSCQPFVKPYANI